MKRIRLLALPLAVAGLLTGAPAASAKPCDDRNTVPPGNSEVDQYSETVPGDCGNENTPSPDGSENPGSSFPPGTAAQFESLGADGRAAALLAAAGQRGDRGNGEAGGAGSEDNPLSGSPAILDPADEEGGVVDSVIDALSGDGGLGIILPLTLVIVLALAITAIVRGRRSAT